MKKLFFFLLFSCAAFAQHTFCPTDGNCTYTGTHTYSAAPVFQVGGVFTPLTVATLPASPSDGQTELVGDGLSTSDCVAGGGTSRVWCAYKTGTGWQSLGGGSGNGTVTSSTQYTTPYYPATGTTVKGAFMGIPFAAFGGKCDGTTDDTSALNTAHTYLQTHGGGKIVFPPGRCLFSSHIVLPDDATPITNGGGTPLYSRQNPITWMGQGDCRNGQGQIPNSTYSGTTFLMTYSGTGVAKVETYGIGSLTIEGVCFYDSGGDTLPFLLTTGTTLVLRDNSFIGSKSGAANNQDVLLLGGTNITYTTLNDPTNAFQGYDSLIDNNYFNYVRRVAILGSWVDHLKFNNNFIGPQSGTNIAAPSGAVEFASGAQAPNNNMFVNNRCEMTNYPYCFVFTSANNNYIAGNDAEDASGSSLALVYFDSASNNNLVVQSLRSSMPVTMVDNSSGNSNTLLSSQNDGFIIGGIKVGTFKATTAVNGQNGTVASANETTATLSNNYAATQGFQLLGQYWNGTASATDTWRINQAISNGTNGATSLHIAHPSGSSGTATVSFDTVALSFPGASSTSGGVWTFGSGSGPDFTDHPIFDSYAILRNSTTATSGSNPTGNCFYFYNNYWNGTASALNQICEKIAASGSGANPNYFIDFSQSGGSTGSTTLRAPNLSLNAAGGHYNTFNATNDTAGTIAISAATSASKTFTTAYTSAPICQITPTSDPTSVGVYWVTSSTTTVTANVKTSGTITFNFVCIGAPN